MTDVADELEVILPLRHVLLHLRVGLTDDGQEHVQEDKEDKEDVDDKVEWTENDMGRLDCVHVEVAKDYTVESEPSGATGK